MWKNCCLFSGGSWGGAQGPGPPPYFGVKKEEMTKGREAGWESKIKLGPSLAQSLDPPLILHIIIKKVQSSTLKNLTTILFS